ncbi:aspartate kinase 3 [Actinidia rufa]|uniref:aspartate kinase n=1 Tax=Actinidia rufa TaxID=165716 RepID=A0A7J0GZL5_9ERIC|nr:aspartate kinase 3 [Actinidia rufa]
MPSGLKFVEVYFIAKKQYKFLIDDNLPDRKEVGQEKYKDWRLSLVSLQFLLLGNVQHLFLLLGVLVCLAVAIATLLVSIPLVVVDVPQVLVVEEVVDVLLAIVVAVVVAHKSVLIRRTILLIIVGIFMAVLLLISPWVIDFGASAHMTGSPGHLSNLSPGGFLSRVTFVDGSTSKIHGLGIIFEISKRGIRLVADLNTMVFTILIRISPAMWLFSLPSFHSKITCHLGHPSLSLWFCRVKVCPHFLVKLVNLVWKDVDGVLTCDPNIYPDAEPVPYLTFDEAAELAYFGAQVLHPQSMRPAREGDIPVRVKNSYNPMAPGTLITRTRDMSEAVLTSIVLKRNVTMLDIASTCMLGQFGFLAKVFSIFEDLGISVDVVATSEVSISLTLDPSKLWSRELIQQASELDHVVEELEKIAVVNLLQNRSIISLIGNVQRSSLILEKAFCVLRTNGINVQMMISQGASKVNISLIVHDSEAEQCVRALHSAFFASDIAELDGECGSQNGSASNAAKLMLTGFWILHNSCLP